MIAGIAVEGLCVDCLIGCLDPERRQVQPIRVDLEIGLEITAAADGDDLRRTRDYAAISREVRFILQSGRFHLLETAARFLLRWLLLPPPPGDRGPPVRSARVALTKFHALPGEATARVSLAAEALDYTRERNPWGTVDVVDECRRVGLYRLNVAPGQAIPNHYHQRTREAELILSGGLVGWREGGRPAPRAVGERFRWARREEHGYRNEGVAVASILCMDAPPFDPADEVEA